MMARHFKVDGDKVACGKNDHDIVGSSAVEGITCSACRNTKAYKAALAAANQNVTEIPGKGLRTPQSEWRGYITGLRGRNRLPRGFSGQPFV